LDNETFLRQHAKVGWDLVKWLRYLLDECGVDALEGFEMLTVPPNINQEITELLDDLTRKASIVGSTNKATTLVK